MLLVNSRKWALKRDDEKVVFDLLIELSCFSYGGLPGHGIS